MDEDLLDHILSLLKNFQVEVEVRYFAGGGDSGLAHLQDRGLDPGWGAPHHRPEAVGVFWVFHNRQNPCVLL